MECGGPGLVVGTQGPKLCVWDLGFRVCCLWFRVWVLGFGVWGFESWGFRVWGLGVMVSAGGSGSIRAGLGSRGLKRKNSKAERERERPLRVPGPK